MVLHLAQEHDIALAQISPRPGMRHQVERLGSVACVDDLAAALRAYEPGDARSRSLVLLCGDLAKFVHAAVDIGVRRAVVGVHRVKHDLGLLRCRRTVQEDEGLAMHRAREDGEVGADTRPIHLFSLLTHRRRFGSRRRVYNGRVGRSDFYGGD